MPAPQLALGFRAPPDQRFETYLAPADGLIAALQALATGDGERSIVLQGPAGSGKTHLALATCAAAQSAGHAVFYLSLPSAAGRLERALANLDAAALVALDGVEAVAGVRADEVALFDLHNRVAGSGRRLLYTCAAPPEGLLLALPDLRSRLAQCTRFLLAPLDDAGRGRMLRQRAERRGLVLEDAALDWLLRRVGRDLSGLAALLDRLDAASLARQRRLTVPFLREVLGAG